MAEQAISGLAAIRPDLFSRSARQDAVTRFLVGTAVGGSYPDPLLDFSKVSFPSWTSRVLLLPPTGIAYSEVDSWR